MSVLVAIPCPPVVRPRLSPGRVREILEWNAAHPGYVAKAVQAGCVALASTMAPAPVADTPGGPAVPVVPVYAAPLVAPVAPALPSVGWVGVSTGVEVPAPAREVFVPSPLASAGAGPGAVTSAIPAEGAAAPAAGGYPVPFLRLNQGHAAGVDRFTVPGSQTVGAVTPSAAGGSPAPTISSLDTVRPTAELPTGISPPLTLADLQLPTAAVPDQAPAAPVPEPATLAMLGAWCLVLGVLRRWGRRN